MLITTIIQTDGKCRLEKQKIDIQFLLLTEKSKKFYYQGMPAGMSLQLSNKMESGNWETKKQPGKTFFSGQKKPSQTTVMQ